MSSTCALLEELTAQSAGMEAKGEAGQSKGGALTLMLRVRLRTMVLNLDQHPTLLLSLRGLLPICLGPAGAGHVPAEGGGGEPPWMGHDSDSCWPVPTLLAERW